MTRTLFALSQHATACDNKLQIAVRNDMRLFLRTTKYYSVLKKVLLQYYPVLNTAPATQNDSHDQSSSHMKRYLQCAE